MVKNLPASARDVGSIPGPGRAHMPWGNASLWAITTEACLPQGPCSPKRKAAPRQSLHTPREQPLFAPTRENPQAATSTHTIKLVWSLKSNSKVLMEKPEATPPGPGLSHRPAAADLVLAHRKSSHRLLHLAC